MKKFGNQSVSLNIKNTGTNRYASIIWKHDENLDKERFDISTGPLNKLTVPEIFEEINEPIDFIVNNDDEDHRITFEIIPNWENDLINIKIKKYPQIGDSILTKNEKEGFYVRIVGN
ncbi:hypothetical protein SAMN04488057_11252 [Cyclobacterium lianum]|uniref:Uncharacterized protein n=1 Tax=Cyclobacterium lianum TaxID=388280 RepID=A0A1M7PZ49_9BACT|nr:hypothetical protein [Cyclobacterium lianum]SHN23041.1 hypothetical protein SAMN04488057_11252 [Cyclobacterium lianum]